jgi:hypothetical protein
MTVSDSLDRLQPFPLLKYVTHGTKGRFSLTALEHHSFSWRNINSRTHPSDGLQIRNRAAGDVQLRSHYAAEIVWLILGQDLI